MLLGVGLNKSGPGFIFGLRFRVVRGFLGGERRRKNDKGKLIMMNGKGKE